MIPRTLVPKDARPPAADTPSTRRRPTTLDQRTLVPATLPIIQLSGHSNIPSSLPLEAIAARTVVPRDLDREAFGVEERHDLPLQPTDLDERITVPQGAAPPEVLTPIENIPTDLVDPDIFTTGEVQFMPEPVHAKEQAKWEAIRNVSSVVFHFLIILAIIFGPKIFPPRPKTKEELDLGRRQMTILLPPGALENLDPPKVVTQPPQPKSPAMRVNPEILRKVAPPEPKPTPGPKEPERVVKDLPSAPVPQPKTTPPPADLNVPSAKLDAPKPPPPKLERPEDQPAPKGLILPKNSPGGSIQESLREAAKMNAPQAIGGGGRLPPGSPGGGGSGTAYGAMEMLTPNEGVDFSNYLARVYQSVKQNWFAVMPVSVQLGDKGVVSLQFKIMRDGNVPDGDPRRVFGSGKEPLDRAAVSSIRASNPFEPLPSAFSGPYIELRFTYYYNIPPEFVH
jgi:TonB C terminal